MVNNCELITDVFNSVDTVLNLDGTLADSTFVHKTNSNLAMLLIDMQTDYVGSLSKKDYDLIVPSQIEMIQYCADKDIPVIVVECLGNNKTITPLINEVYGSNVRLFIKNQDSAFATGVLSRYLKSNYIDNLLLAGMNSMSCVLKTALHAKHNEFKVSTANNLISNGSDWEILFTREDVKEIYQDNNITFYDSHRDFIKLLL